MNENKTPAREGVYTCKFVNAMRSTKSNRAMHYVLNIRLRPLDCGVAESDVCEYFAELPLCFKTGAEFGFYDADTKTNKVRKCVAKDTETAIEYARKCFPAWSEYIDQLPETASFADAFAWFDQQHDDVTVRAKVKDVRYWQDSNGEQHPSYDANIYAAVSGGAVGDADAFNAEFGNVLKAAKVKFGGGVKKSVPTPPPAPKAKAATATLNDAWDAYNLGSMIVNDPKGEKFYETVNNIIGHDYTNATPEDWAKCVAAFKA